MASAPALAYGPGVLAKMTSSTLKLAPASLRGVLTSYRKYVDQGVRDTIDKEGRQPGPVLVSAIQEEITQMSELPKRQAPFEEVAYRFGRVAALAFLLNDPLRDSSDPKIIAVREDYAGYMERKLPKMPVAFDGYDSPPMQGDAGSYFQQRFKGQERYREALLFCYYPPSGKAVSSETFDDRSNAFAVVQAIASHAVSDAAKMWFYIWKAMDGDISATPFYQAVKDKQ
ncbi:MAG: hypothetical protein JHC34_00895 [Acidobacteria bacterium]|jgi:hypothetical protein|nr:hypothetical protein [Acidobacteriota bacterium]